MLTLNNPRLTATIDDYPLGGSKRGKCVFAVESSGRGWRVSRTTFGKPKYTTYSGYAAICDGNDGRTYIVQQSTPPYPESITVSRSDFKNADTAMGGKHYFTPDDARYPELLALIARANTPANAIA
jgi:hypothetical protein